MVLGYWLIQVDRKLVKQTVMTSVYGVTYVGAREQIKRRLQEKGYIADEKLLFKASCYAARVSNCACNNKDILCSEFHPSAVNLMKIPLFFVFSFSFLFFLLI